MNISRKLDFLSTTIPDSSISHSINKTRITIESDSDSSLPELTVESLMSKNTTTITTKPIQPLQLLPASIITDSVKEKSSIINQR